MTTPVHLIRWFLRENPECIPDARRVVIDGVTETVLTPECAMALSEWMCRTGRPDPAKAKQFRESLRRDLGK